jgi:putative colanic acid biosynthesis acetyltransferase WcaF
MTTELHKHPPDHENKRRLRAVSPLGRGDKLHRIVWGLVHVTLYRWSPTPLHGWRCILLRAFGARIEGPAYVYPTARVWAPWRLDMAKGSCLGPDVNCYNVGGISLGPGATVSQNSHLCGASHDHRDASFPLVVGKIVIGRNAWVAADAFVGPGVWIGEDAVVGARAVVVKDVPAGMIVVGNPARVVGSRSTQASPTQSNLKQ